MQVKGLKAALPQSMLISLVLVKDYLLQDLDELVGYCIYNRRKKNQGHDTGENTVGYLVVIYNNITI